MDVKSLILDDAQINATTEEKKERKENKAVYTIDVDSGCDFAISKTKGRSVSQFVCLISQKQFYMVVNKQQHVFKFTPNGELEDSADKRRINLFFSEYDGSLEFSENSVIYNNLPSDTSRIANLISSLSDDIFLENAKSGWAYLDDNGYWFGLCKEDPAFNLKRYMIDKIIAASNGNLTKKQALYNNCYDLERTTTYGGKKKYRVTSKAQGTDVQVSLHYDALTNVGWNGDVDTVDFLHWICETMGYDNAKYIVETLMNAYVYEAVLRGWGNRYKKTLASLENIQFDKYAFCNYVVYQAMAEGWSDNYQNFFNTWFDALEMEKSFYGKIKEKYPKNLATYHQIIAYKLRLIQQVVNKTAFEENVAKYIDYEYAYGDYMIRIPRSSDEMIDEAIGQSNCLREYIKHICNGLCGIAFMRKRETPDESYVTIEIRPDGTIGQVYGAMNAIPNGEALAFVKKWAQDKKLVYEPVDDAKKNLDTYIAKHGAYKKV